MSDAEGRATRPVVPWARPLRVTVDEEYQTVKAFYSATGGHREPAARRIFSDFLRIGRATTPQAKIKAISAFAEKHGLLNSPFSRDRPMESEGEEVSYTEDCSEYTTLSSLLGATKRIHEALRVGAKLSAEDVKLVADFVEDHEALEVRFRLLRAIAPVDFASVRNVYVEPLPIEYRGKAGDRRKAWRALQAQRVLEVFGIWCQEGRVRPIMVREGETLVMNQWTGGAWGALAGELQEDLTSTKPLGVCGYCGSVYEGRVKTPRKSYGGREVVLCCGSAECRKERSRAHARRSRGSRARVG